MRIRHSLWQLLLRFYLVALLGLFLAAAAHMSAMAGMPLHKSVPLKDKIERKFFPLDPEKPAIKGLKSQQQEAKFYRLRSHHKFSSDGYRKSQEIDAGTRKQLQDLPPHEVLSLFPDTPIPGNHPFLNTP